MFIWSFWFLPWCWGVALCTTPRRPDLRLVTLNGRRV